MVICHYVHLYVIIYGEKHSFCDLSPYTAISSHCMLFFYIEIMYFCILQLLWGWG